MVVKLRGGGGDGALLNNNTSVALSKSDGFSQGLSLFLSTAIYTCTRYSLGTQFSRQHGKSHHKWTFLYHSSILRFCTAQDGQHSIED
jgi:hypothetical protein